MKKVLNILVCCMLVLSLAGCGTKEASDNKENGKEYYCEEGNLNGTVCEIIATEDAVETCDKDYKLTDGKCVKTTTKDAKATKSCSDGYTLNGSTCVSDKTYDKVTTKECVLPKDLADEGFSKGSLNEEGKCSTSACAKYRDGECIDGAIDEYDPTTVTACPSGTKEIDGKCYKTSKVKTTYTCSEGKLSGSKCTITDSKEVTNTCKTDGFTYNAESKQCEKVTTTEALKK